VRLFVKNFAPPFPVGYNSGAEAYALIHPTGKLPMVPLLAFIDKRGILRAQHEGEEPFFTDLEANLRREIEALAPQFSRAVLAKQDSYQLTKTGPSPQPPPPAAQPEYTTTCPLSSNGDQGSVKRSAMVRHHHGARNAPMSHPPR